MRWCKNTKHPNLGMEQYLIQLNHWFSRLANTVRSNWTINHSQSNLTWNSRMIANRIKNSWIASTSLAPMPINNRIKPIILLRNVSISTLRNNPSSTHHKSKINRRPRTSQVCSFLSRSCPLIIIQLRFWSKTRFYRPCPSQPPGWTRKNQRIVVS